MFESRDLMASVHRSEGLILFPDTCRISANDPHGQPGCQDRSRKPAPPPPPVKPPVCKPSQPQGKGGGKAPPKPPRSRTGLAELRHELRAVLAGAPPPG